MKDLKVPFYQILEILKNEITDKYEKIDFIVPMPSKHNLSTTSKKIAETVSSINSLRKPIDKKIKYWDVRRSS